MKKLSFYLLLLLFVIAAEFKAFADDNHIPVRVGISNTNFSSYLFDLVEFNNANSLKIIDAVTGYSAPVNADSKVVKVTSENNLFRIYIDGELKARNLTGPILISPEEGGVISVSGLKRKGKQALYRGYIELVRSSKDISKFSIVNVLSLKNYLKGVVPNEMPVRFGIEALKAQTVAARNYAVTPRVKAYKEFDLCDSVACQVYYGANTENMLSDKAIDETNGIIALDSENKPILALYSSTAGGYTESYEYAFSDPNTRVFPSNDIPYLQAVPDNKGFAPLETEDEAQKFYMSKPEAYDDESPYFRWSKEWTKDELEQVLAKTLVSQSKTGFISPILQNSEDFGHLISIKPLQRGKSGKIIKLEIKTDKNTFIVQKELVIRRCFQKNAVSLPSANFVVVNNDEDENTYKFFGGGFGHGVGLSQWGAGKMAKMGFPFDEILQHYYTGIKLATIPSLVLNNNKTIERTFFTEQNYANVIIKNLAEVKNLHIKINEKELDVKLNGDLTKVNISRYLQKGQNKIEYLINDLHPDYKSSVEVFIELKGAVGE